MDRIKLSLFNQEGLPLVIELTRNRNDFGQLLGIVKELNPFFKEKILQHGGLLFRGFSVEGADHFAQVIEAFNAGNFVNYIGGDSPRNKVKGGVYTSTEAPPSVKIPLHNELSFVRHHPKHIYFYCEIPPQSNGETIIGDARAICKSVDAQVKRRFEEKGLKYVSCYYKESEIMRLLNKLQKSHKSWIEVFETESRKEVEEKCLKNEFDFRWQKDDWLQISQKRPAIMTHPQTQEKVWFNQVHLYDFNPRLLGSWRYLGAKVFYMRKHTRLHEVFFSDGNAIPRQDIYHVMDVLDKHTIAFPWQKGDVMILDNVLAMHGRATFQGPRRILTALTS